MTWWDGLTTEQLSAYQRLRSEYFTAARAAEIAPGRVNDGGDLVLVVWASWGDGMWHESRKWWVYPSGKVELVAERRTKHKRRRPKPDALTNLKSPDFSGLPWRVGWDDRWRLWRVEQDEDGDWMPVERLGPETGKPLEEAA